MSEQISKPYVLKAAEKIYFNVCKIKDENLLDNEKAIENFINTEHYDKLCTGEFHNEWLNTIKNNKNIDPETNQKIPDETLRLLEIQRDAMMKELIKIPKLYDAKNHQLIELSKKAYNFLWRMCESYELWCRETKQEDLITLKIID
jgi:hypothetical protein